MMEFELQRDVRSVREARDLVRQHLNGLGCPAHLVDDVNLLVSELVTNAVLHGSEHIRLTCALEPSCVRVEVADGGASDVSPIEAARDAPSGRGLMLGETVATRWAVDHGRSGKTVRFEIDRSET